MEVNRSSRLFKYTGALALLLFVFGSGFALRDISATSNQRAIEQALLTELATVQSDLAVVKNRKLSADRALGEALSTNERLADQLVTMDAAIEHLRFVVNSQGEVAPGETITVVVDNTIPAPDHQYKLANGLVVAELTSITLGDTVEYSYPTYGLRFETSLVVTDDIASVDVLLSSTFDPDNQVRVVQETQSIAIREQDQKLIEPHIGLGISGSAPALALQGSVWSTFIHPRDDLSLLGLRASASSNQISVGLDAGYYNFGKKLPVLTNTWVGAGVSVNQLGIVSGTVTVGAKL